MGIRRDGGLILTYDLGVAERVADEDVLVRRHTRQAGLAAQGPCVTARDGARERAGRAGAG